MYRQAVIPQVRGALANSQSIKLSLFLPSTVDREVFEKGMPDGLSGTLWWSRAGEIGSRTPQFCVPVNDKLFLPGSGAYGRVAGQSSAVRATNQMTQGDTEPVVECSMKDFEHTSLSDKK